MTTYTQQELVQALERCAREPIHQLGSIQPHGAMVVTSSGPDLRILQASANLLPFLGLAEQDILGKSMAELLGETAAAVVQALIAKSDGRYVRNGTLDAPAAGRLQVRVFPVGELYAMELIPEQVGETLEKAAAAIVSTQRAFLRIEEERDLVRYLEHIAELTREVSGFDRVMIYRFDANWDGEVIAESRGEQVQSYLGTRFPASDIPPQARQLYTRNRFRLVADVQANPVPLLPALNPTTGEPLDLTLSLLRSFSPVHVEYLRNMGVMASMSISLLQNGRLWGLVACHHMSPRTLPAAVQETVVRIGQIASSRLSALEAEQRQNLGGEVSAIIGLLLKYINVDSEQAVLDLMKVQLLRLFDASGLIVVIEGQVYALGDVPDRPAIDGLLGWLGTLAPADALAFDDLSLQHPPAAAYIGIASGLMAAPISAGMHNSMIWLRPERLRTVRWAGSPEKTIQTDASGLVRLSPRKSFESWAEAWRGRSASWTTPAVEAAAILARALTEGIAQKSRLTQAQAAQREVEQRYSLALQATNDGIWDWNLQTGTVFINPAFSEMLGYASGELGPQVDQLWPALLHPDERERVLSDKHRQLRDAGHYEMEFRLRCQDGSYSWILSRGTVLERDAAGAPVRAIGTHIDLTLRKQMETELREAKDYAEAANRAKSLFLANMSHELRTPLNGIIGMTDLVRGHLTDPKDLDLLSRALQAAKHLARLVNDLLDISRLESERLTLEVVPFNLETVLADTLTAIGQRAAAKGLHFTLSLAEAAQGRWLTGDPQRIEQVLGSLVGNAVKFTETGHVALRIGVAEEHTTGLTLRFEVEDSGIGIPPEHQARLFSLFEQGDGSATRKHGGTGLGLVLSKRLVDLMGGEIGVIQRDGPGSLFWFTVPLGVPMSADLPPVPVLALPAVVAAEPPAEAAQTHPDAQAGSTAAPVDIAALQAVCTNLLSMIETGEVEAQDQVETHREMLRHAAPGDFEPLRQALLNFDFDQAEALLRGVMRQHGLDAAHD